MGDYIKIVKRDIFKLGLADDNGEPKLDENGNQLYLEFDLADVELPLKMNKCEYLIRKAKTNLSAQMTIIGKKQDKKGKMLLSANEEEKLKAIRTFYDEMEEAIDLFIGKGGTRKIFGDRRYWEMFDDLTEWLEPHMPKLKINVDSMKSRIEEKYKTIDDKELK